MINNYSKGGLFDTKIEWVQAALNKKPGDYPP